MHIVIKTTMHLFYIFGSILMIQSRTLDQFEETADVQRAIVDEVGNTSHHACISCLYVNVIRFCIEIRYDIQLRAYFTNLQIVILFT